MNCQVSHLSFYDFQHKFTKTSPVAPEPSIECVNQVYELPSELNNSFQKFKLKQNAAIVAVLEPSSPSQGPSSTSPPPTVQTTKGPIYTILYTNVNGPDRRP